MNIPFPNVPAVAGVPAILRSPNFPSSAAAPLGVLQGALWRSISAQDNWGIFDKDGKKLVDIEKTYPIISGLFGSQISTVSVDYKKDMRVSEFPVEGGSFATYNKVEMPAEARVMIGVTGGESQRSQVLNAIDGATKGVYGYVVVTPEATYDNYTITHYNYQRRAENGATLLLIELFLKEVRTIAPMYSMVDVIKSPSNPTDTPTASTGNVQSEINQSILTQSVDIIKGLFK